MSTQPKGAIICKSRYGATRQYAEWLGAHLDLPIFDPDIDRPQLKEYNYLLIGSSVYMGKMLIKDWLLTHRGELNSKKLFFFVVCATPNTEKDKQRKIAKDNIPAELAEDRVIFFLPGRLIISRLSWKDRLFLRLGARLEKDPRKKAAMRHDMDGMDLRYLDPLIDAVKATQSTKNPLYAG
ncbi:MAG: hypothetical protein J0H74_32755 [Chitinophagaceae bacterium]|nr:hypothetical protein [Chitinophagaceae bacterium]